ncbi:MAG: hypothetical protein Q8R98_25490, partial [Rubrivivax sp.]|nr:hypothetical protein [Rubrivivax sp.]
YMQVPVMSAPAGTYRMVLGITPDFVRFYDWQFPLNSLGFLAVTGGTLGDWQGLLGARGLRTLVAFSADTDLPRMLAAAEDFFHLTLATNHLEGSARGSLDNQPRLRNFGNGETLQFLLQRRVVDSGSLAYFPQATPADYVNALTPTIDHLLVDEETLECELVGQFGAPDVGSVKHGGELNTFAEPLLADAADPTLRFGSDLSITDWRGDFIACRLPEHLTGSRLQVFNGGRWSNVASLTYWTVPVTVRDRISGGLMLDVSFELHFRHDVRGFRLRPDQPVAQQIPVVSVNRMKRSQAQWTASGQLSRTEGDTTTQLEWSGSSLVQAGGPGGFVAFGGQLDLAARRMVVVLAMSAEGRRERTVVTRSGSTVSDSTFLGPLGVAFPLDPSMQLVMEFADDWTLVAGSASANQPVSLLGSRTREVTVSWPAASPMLPPRDKEGGV